MAVFKTHCCDFSGLTLETILFPYPPLILHCFDDIGLMREKKNISFEEWAILC